MTENSQPKNSPGQWTQERHYFDAAANSSGCFNIELIASRYVKCNGQSAVPAGGCVRGQLS